MALSANKKYRPLWESNCFITIVTGGRGSGKSFMVGDFIENLSFERGHKILFTRYTLHSASDSIIPEFEEKIGLEGHAGCFYSTKTDVVNKMSGVEIMFRGIKTSSGSQTAKLKSIEGLTTWVIDEAEELDDEKTFNTIMQSIRKKGTQNRIIIVLNPKSKLHWIYERFFETPGVDPKFNGEHDGVCYIHTCYLENLDNLSVEFIEEADRCKRLTPEIYRYDYLGEWVLSIEGAFLPMDSLKRYKKLIEGDGPMLAYFDVADEGDDYMAGIFCKLINNKLYAIDAIFNQVNLSLNEEVCKTRFKLHKIDKGYIETNAMGAYFLRNIREQNEGIPFQGIVSKANKLGRILAQCGWILENCYFPEHPNEELWRFMVQMCSVTHETKKEDDAADSMAGIAMVTRAHYTRN